MRSLAEGARVREAEALGFQKGPLSAGPVPSLASCPVPLSSEARFKETLPLRRAHIHQTRGTHGGCAMGPFVLFPFGHVLSPSHPPQVLPEDPRLPEKQQKPTQPKNKSPLLSSEL